LRQNRSSIRVPKKLAGKKVVLVDAAEYAALKRRLAEVSDALEKNIARRRRLSPGPNQNRLLSS